MIKSKNESELKYPCEAMPVTALLKEIIEALEMPNQEYSSFLDLDSGKVESVSKKLLRAAEEDPDEQPYLPNWQKEEWEIAKRIISSDRFILLPDEFEIDEWQTMHDFANSLRSKRIREDLLNAIHGRGAFRNFKHQIRQHRVEKDWYTFRDQALRQFAIEWCEENQIEWRDA